MTLTPLTAGSVNPSHYGGVSCPSTASRLPRRRSPAPPFVRTTPLTTDEELIARAVAGDELAMRALWAEHAPRVDAVVRRLVHDLDEAADIAQEVWIQIFRALPTFRGDAQFSTWAHRIAVKDRKSVV